MLRLTDAHKDFGRLGPGSGMRASLCSPLLKNAIFQSRRGVGSTGAFPWLLKPLGIKLARRPGPPTKYWAVLLVTTQVVILAESGDTPLYYTVLRQSTRTYLYYAVLLQSTRSFGDGALDLACALPYVALY